MQDQEGDSSLARVLQDPIAILIDLVLMQLVLNAFSTGIIAYRMSCTGLVDAVRAGQKCAFCMF